MPSSLGFDKPLYILSFDYRGALQTAFEWESVLTAEQAAEIASAMSEISEAKGFIYNGFKAALAAGAPEDRAGILVDEHFGAAILADAAAQGYVTACPVEKSGQEEFDFEYGEGFAKHIETFHPTLCKVQVSFNPESDERLNRRQSGRLRRLSEYLRGSRSLFMLELLVPPTKAQLHKGDMEWYELEVRPRLMVQAIGQLQDEQVEPDIWGIQGLESREDCERVVAAARRSGRHKVSCIVLGEAEDSEKVREWLTTAAAVPGFIGFAVGRTIFWGPVSRWLARQSTPKATVAEISQHYRDFVNIFEKDRSESIRSERVG